MKHPTESLLRWAVAFKLIFLFLLGGGAATTVIGIVLLITGSTPEALGMGVGIMISSLFFRYLRLITHAVAIAAKNKHI